MAGLLAVAATLAGTGFALTQSRAGGRVASPAVPLLGKYLAIVLLGLVVAVEIAVVARNFSVNELPPRKRRSTVAALGFLVGSILIVWALQHSRLHLDRLPKPSQLQKASKNAGHAAAQAHRGSQALGDAVTLLLFLAILGLVGGTFYLWRAGRAGRTGERLRRTLAAELRRAELDLESIADARLAVLACYERLQATLPEHGIDGTPADTPTEVVGRLRDAAHVDGDSPERLARLFERARFSPHPVSEAMRHEALAAVSDVREQLEIGEEP